MIRSDDLQVFVYAADAGGFSAAARQLDITPALASSAVQRLEKALGARLFLRSTRSMRLSEDGERYLPHARASVDAVARGRDALAEGRKEISGTLKLSLPSDLGRNVLLPWLDAFQDQHRRLTLQLRMSDQNADFYRLQLDAGLRYGALGDSSMVSLPVAPDNRRIVCAAPEYLARYGVPDGPEALREHNCLCYVMGEQTYNRWQFDIDGTLRTVAVRGDRVCDDADVVRRWALAGKGITYKSWLDVAADIQAGRLVALFPAAYGQATPLQLVSPHRNAITPAVQQLRAFLVRQCAAIARRS